MKLEYFSDTDTLYIDLREGETDVVVDVGQDTLVDLDGQGIPLGITIEHAADRFDLVDIGLKGLPLAVTTRKAA